MKERILYSRIALALASMAIVSPFVAQPAMAAAQDEIYDFGSSDIYAEKSAEPAEAEAEQAPASVEPVAESTEEPAPEKAYPGG